MGNNTHTVAVSLEVVKEAAERLVQREQPQTSTIKAPWIAEIQALGVTRSRARWHIRKAMERLYPDLPRPERPPVKNEPRESRQRGWAEHHKPVLERKRRPDGGMEFILTAPTVDLLLAAARETGEESANRLLQQALQAIVKGDVCADVQSVTDR